MPRIQVERYVIPFPDLQFQNLTGTQKVTNLEGERVAQFTTSEGTTYVLLTSNGFLDITILGEEGSDVILQTLAIPGDAFGGYPALRVLVGTLAVNPADGQAGQFTGSADQPNTVVEDPGASSGMENYVPPTIVIEEVELVYYFPDPRLQNADSGIGYIQPAWRFSGNTSDGSKVEFLVQALKQEFFLPELEPHAGPG